MQRLHLDWTRIKNKRNRTGKKNHKIAILLCPRSENWTSLAGCKGRLLDVLLYRGENPKEREKQVTNKFELS